MKLIIKVLILTYFCIFALANSNLKSESKAKAKLKEDFTKQWTALFTTLVQPPQLCEPPEHLNNEESEDGDSSEEERLTSTNTPSPKANKWAKNQGFGDSAYLFDYIDDIFQADLISQFEKMYAAAKAIAPATPPTFEDPYTVEKLLYYFSQGASGLSDQSEAPPASLATPTADQLAQMQKYLKNFNPTIWQNSISAAQLYNIVEQWGWRKSSKSKPIKRLLDKFDFDGDGRLNPSEFVLLSIINNSKGWDRSECKQFCYTDTLINKIDPLFAYLDCDVDGFMSAENMWIGYANLKRKDPTKYNMYSCQMPNALNKGYRTNSPGDFILKNSHKADGFVTRHEFRLGILLGYWDRQTDQAKIYTDDSKNLKSFRWADNGLKDIVCESILALVPNPKKRKTPPIANAAVQGPAPETSRKMKKKKF